MTKSCTTLHTMTICVGVSVSTMLTVDSDKELYDTKHNDKLFDTLFRQ